MSKKELLASTPDTKTRNCIVRGCGQLATGNVEMETLTYVTKQVTRRNTKEFCEKHGKELEKKYSEKKR